MDAGDTLRANPLRNLLLLVLGFALRYVVEAAFAPVEQEQQGIVRVVFMTLSQKSLVIILSAF
ncbi:hypothetical protein CPB97_002237 [Podila verticillata]|nr:hypothetical protein CPB97_002237 [Podila verticillata]